MEASEFTTCWHSRMIRVVNAILNGLRKCITGEGAISVKTH